GFDRIFVDIVDSHIKVGLIADVAVEVIRCPECTCQAKLLVGLLGGERFPGMNDVAERGSADLLNEHTDMVRHDHPCNPPIASSIEMMKCILNDRCDHGIA